MYILLRWLEWIKQPHKALHDPRLLYMLRSWSHFGNIPSAQPKPKQQHLHSKHKITKPYENKPTGFLFVMHLVKELQQPGLKLVAQWNPAQTSVAALHLHFHNKEDGTNVMEGKGGENKSNIQLKALLSSLSQLWKKSYFNPNRKHPKSH